MGWARSAWMAVILLAFAAGNATAAEPKRVLLLHSFGWNFQAEDAFGDYLRTDLAEKSPYPLDPYEVVLRDRALQPTASGTKRSRAICEPFSRPILPI